MVMAQYLSKYFIDKYEYEALPVRTSMNPESVAAMVYDSNITLTSLRIIYNYIIYAFGKRAILPE